MPEPVAEAEVVVEGEPAEPIFECFEVEHVGRPQREAVAPVVAGRRVADGVRRGDRVEVSGRCGEPLQLGRRRQGEPGRDRALGQGATREPVVDEQARRLGCGDPDHRVCARDRHDVHVADGRSRAIDIHLRRHDRGCSVARVRVVVRGRDRDAVLDLEDAVAADDRRSGRRDRSRERAGCPSLLDQRERLRVAARRKRDRLAAGSLQVRIGQGEGYG